MSREMFEPYDLLKESKMLHEDTLNEHRNIIIHGKQFGSSIG